MSDSDRTASIQWDACPACDKAWVDHLGIAGTCRQLQIALAEVEKLRMIVKETEAPDPDGRV